MSLLKRVKKGAAGLLVASMILSMAACAKSDDPKRQEPEAAEDMSESEGKVQEAAGEDFGEVSLEEAQLDLFVNHTWWPLPKWSGSVPEYITQQTGVDLNVTIAADSQQLPLMISSGELPDLIYTDNSGNMITLLSDPDLCWDWENLMEDYGSGFIFD